MLQSQGVAMNAPQTYPGEGALRAIVNASIPAKDLYSSRALLTPAQQAALGQTDKLNDLRQRRLATAWRLEASGATGAIRKRRQDKRHQSAGLYVTYQSGKQRLADLGYHAGDPART